MRQLLPFRKVHWVILPLALMWISCCTRYELTYNAETVFYQFNNNSTSNVLDYLYTSKTINSQYYGEQYLLMSIDGLGMQIAHYEIINTSKSLRHYTSFESCFINADYENINLNKYNPTFYYDGLSNQFAIISKPSMNASGAVRTVYNMTDLSILFMESLPLHLYGVRPLNSDSVLFRDEEGTFGLIQNICQLTPITYFFPLSPTTSFTLQQYLSSSIILSGYASYALTIDPQTINFKIYHILYSSPNISTYSLYNNIDVSDGNISILKSYCFYKESFVYLHYANGSLIQYTFHSNIPVKIINSQYFNSQACYYDDITTSVILATQNITNQSIVLNQISLVLNATYNQTIITSEPGFLVLSKAYGGSLTFKRMNAIIYYNYQSCTNSYLYNETTFHCYRCPTGCTKCNSTQFCTSCKVGYNYTLNQYCCLPGYYSTFPTRTCVICPSPCLTCENSTFCYTCSANYSIINHLCAIANNSTTNHTSNLTAINNTNYTFEEDQTIVNYQQFLQSSLNNSLISFVNKFPASRSILKNVFACLINFDQIYLYQFHQRNYSNSMKELFKLIGQLQAQKWSAYDNIIINPILSSLNVNKTSIFDALDTQKNYSSAIFVQMQGYGQNFFINTWSFLTTTFISSLFVFILAHILFKILFNYRISVVLRPFDFAGYFCLMLTEGNIQYFIFYLTSELKMNFFIKFEEKILKIIVIFILFLCSMFALGGYVIFYVKYKKLLKYFTQNCRFSYEVIGYFLFQSCLKQFLAGVIHNLLRQKQSYSLQLPLLISIDIVSMIWSIRLVTFEKIFLHKLIVWMTILLFSMRIFLIYFLILQQIYCDDFSINGKLDQIIQKQIIMYIVTIYAQIAVSIIYLLIEGYEIIQKIKKDTQKQLEKELKKQIRQIKEPDQKNANKMEELLFNIGKTEKKIKLELNDKVKHRQQVKNPKLKKTQKKVSFNIENNQEFNSSDKDKIPQAINIEPDKTKSKNAPTHKNLRKNHLIIQEIEQKSQKISKVQL